MSPISTDRPVIRRPGQNAVVFGLRGSGKTTLVRRLIRAHPRVLIVDPQREYGAVSVQVGSLEELADYLERTEGHWRVSYFSLQLEEEFDLLCAAAWQLGNLLFVVEEADRFCSPSVISPPFYQLIHYGRHAAGGPVDFLGVSRRPANVNRALTSQAYEAYCFTLAEPADFDYLSKWISRELADTARILPPFRYRMMDLYDRTKAPQDLSLQS